jgi:predicted nucleic acid-binding Zn ribbon protein
MIVATVESRLDTHEAVCAERYGKIELQFESSNARLKRIEMILIGAAGAMLLVLLNIAIKMG